MPCEDCTFPLIQCIPRIWGMRIINAGYRKEKEVQAETARRIYEYLRSKEIYDSFPIVDFDEVRKICEEFGAEVDG